MWDPKDAGEWWHQRASFLQPVAPPDAEICDPPLACITVNMAWLQVLAGAAAQLAQPSSWLVATDADRELAVRRATDLLFEIGNAMPCNPEPPGILPPHTQACNIAGYLSNFVIREAILQAVQAARQDLSILSFAQQLISWIPGISFWYVIFSSTIIDFLAQIVGGDLSDYEAALSDDALWSQVACKILACIETDGKVTQANWPCIHTALCSLTYPLADVKDRICQFVEGLGADQMIAAQTPGAAETYTCDCGGAGVIGRPGPPARITTGKERILIAAGNAVGTALVRLLKAYPVAPILLPGGDNPVLIPSFSGVTPNSFTLEVEAARAVDVDTYVDVDWVALPQGISP